mgnify:FL=1
MLDIEKLAKKPKVFHSLCGLTPDKFNALLLRLEPLWEEAELKRKNWEGRKRKIGGGIKPKLSLAQKLFILLLYYRTYINHVFIGMIAGIDDSNVSRNINPLEPVLAQIFKIPQKKINITEQEILELIVDATEQETEKRSGSGYSGKKKRQTVKTQIYVTRDGNLKAVSKSYAGNIHDKKIHNHSKTYCVVKGKLRRVKKKGDLGYIGTECETPIKSSKYHKLTEKEKRCNKLFSAERIIVEHVISFLKKFHILSYRFRNKISRHNLIFKNIAGIRNFITA